jgi:hypothetical protein
VISAILATFTTFAIKFPACKCKRKMSCSEISCGGACCLTYAPAFACWAPHLDGGICQWRNGVRILDKL